jgi:hypothetical protein
MATLDLKGAHSALEQLITEQRAKLVGAHAVQKCLYEVLLYADGADAVMHAEAAHVVATLMEDIVDRLDSMHLLSATKETNGDRPAERAS